jgi:polyhydroxyalkanoate synthesis regulator phasin
VRPVSPAESHPIKVSLDDHSNSVLRRVTKSGRYSGYIRAAILEKAARDEMRGEVDELRAEVAQLRDELKRTRREAGLDE